MVVYADVLLLINFYIDYLLLLATEKLCRVRACFRRRLLGAAIGALSSLCVLLPQAPFALCLTLQGSVAAVTVLAAYGRARVGPFVRRVLCFFGATYLFAGLVLLVQRLVVPEGVMVHHGVVYWDVSPLLLLGSTTVCYGGLWLFRRLFSRSQGEELALSLIVQIGERRECLCALYDTGNHLCEPLSGDPVIVVDPAFASRLLGAKEADDLLSLAVSPSRPKGYRLIPYQAVGKEGLLPAFRPDRASRNGVELPRLYLAVSPTPLREGYDGIAGPAILEEGEKALCCVNSHCG